MTEPPRLSPTSYALLGLVAREPRSAYDLNRLMQNSLMRVFWPRVESHVYSEPKKLLARQLVTERREKVNGRNRSVYSITEKGSIALAEWLQAEGSTELRTSSELMLKLLLASGSPAGQARNILVKSREASRVDLLEAIAGIEQLLQSPDAGVAGMPWNGIAANLMADILIARYHWSSYALETEANPGSPAEKQEAGREAYTRALHKMCDAIEGKL